MEINIELPEKLLSVFHCPATYRGAYGGRGAAKTIGFANMAILDLIRLNDRPWNFLFGRELQKSLKDSVFSVVASQISQLGVSDLFDVGREYIRTKSGNECLFYGLKSNIAEVKGLHKVRRTWLEEAQKVSQSSLTYLIPTVMRDFPDCELWGSWNPDDEDDPIHKMFVKDADETVKCIKINYYDNPWFPDSLDKVRLRDKKNNPEMYEWIWEGNFNINMLGAVYGKWISKAEKEGRLRTGLYDPALPVHTAWDIGYSDYTTIFFFQIIGGEIRVIDYYENNREGIQHYAQEMLGIEFIPSGVDAKGKINYVRGPEKEGEIYTRRRTYRYGKHWVPHDAAHKLFAANGRSIVQQADDFGIRMYVISAVSQQNQIQIARVTIDQCWFDTEYCSEAIRALRKYQFEFDEEKQRYNDKPLHDIYSHAADAFEILAQCQKMPIMEKPKQPPAFWQDLKAQEIFFPTNQGGEKKEIY